MDNSINSINSVDQSLADMEVGMGNLTNDLDALKDDMDTQLDDATCRSDEACRNVSMSTSVLSVGLDITQVRTVTNHLSLIHAPN